MSSNSLYANNQRYIPHTYIEILRSVNNLISLFHVCMHVQRTQMYTQHRAATLDCVSQRNSPSEKAKKLNLLYSVHFSLYHCINLNVYAVFCPAVPWYDLNFLEHERQRDCLHFIFLLSTSDIYIRIISYIQMRCK